jgi:ABC-type multidrug transport system ATPase subunit
MEGPRSQGAILVEGVSRGFGDTIVIQNLHLAIPPGTIAAVTGANGAGKTTLLRLVAGLLTPDLGTITVGARRPGTGTTAFVPAGDRGLYWRLTARANLEFFAAIAGSGRDAAAATARALDAERLLDQRIGECSTGERRRVAIARAFASRAAVVLIDEPYADLDEAGSAAVERAARMWADAGGTVVYAAPQIDEGPAAGMHVRLDARSVAGERIR